MPLTLIKKVSVSSSEKMMDINTEVNKLTDSGCVLLRGLIQVNSENERCANFFTSLSMNCQWMCQSEATDLTHANTNHQSVKLLCTQTGDMELSMGVTYNVCRSELVKSRVIS